MDRPYEFSPSWGHIPQHQINDYATVARRHHFYKYLTQALEDIRTLTTDWQFTFLLAMAPTATNIATSPLTTIPTDLTAKERLALSNDQVLNATTYYNQYRVTTTLNRIDVTQRISNLDQKDSVDLLRKIKDSICGREIWDDGPAPKHLGTEQTIPNNLRALYFKVPLSQHKPSPESSNYETDNNRHGPKSSSLQLHRTRTMHLQ
jgi:hypothetical protein